MALNKHQQKSETTRRKLLAAARRVFARTGFEATTIDDVASEAGHTRGAFYANFKSKEDLFFVLLEQQAARNVDVVRRRLELCTTDEERMEQLRDHYVQRAADRAWSILLLEFKLYALRHGRMRAKLVRSHRSIRTKMKLDEIRRLLPVKFQNGRKSHDVHRAALEGILSGLVVEQAYDPIAISESQVASVLGTLFDVVVELNEE